MLEVSLIKGRKDMHKRCRKFTIDKKEPCSAARTHVGRRNKFLPTQNKKIKADEELENSFC